MGFQQSHCSRFQPPHHMGLQQRRHLCHGPKGRELTWISHAALLRLICSCLAIGENARRTGCRASLAAEGRLSRMEGFCAGQQRIASPETQRTERLLLMWHMPLLAWELSMPCHIIHAMSESILIPFGALILSIHPNLCISVLNPACGLVIIFGQWQRQAGVLGGQRTWQAKLHHHPSLIAETWTRSHALGSMLLEDIRRLCACQATQALDACMNSHLGHA